MRNYTISTVAGLALVAALAGCVPESEHPLGNPQTAQQDTELHGLWMADQAEGETQYLHIGAEPEKALGQNLTAPEAGLMRFWLLGHTTEGGRLANPFGMRFFVTRVGDASYANLVLPIDDKDTGSPRSWWFLKYHVDESTLTTWGMDFEAVGKLIETGKVRGTVDRDNRGHLKRALITAPGDEVEEFVTTYNGLLFPDKLKTTFHRIPSSK